mmetsp:Transcript_10457/g.26592  ORF Transcript_10457/g.26592 Transcript_10457/m.26592 type:complete len:303 (-) Transcript_10457:278-1186(-)
MAASTAELMDAVAALAAVVRGSAGLGRIGMGCALAWGGDAVAAAEYPLTAAAARADTTAALARAACAGGGLDGPARESSFFRLFLRAARAAAARTADVTGNGSVGAPKLPDPCTCAMLHAAAAPPAWPTACLQASSTLRNCARGSGTGVGTGAGSSGRRGVEALACPRPRPLPGGRPRRPRARSADGALPSPSAALLDAVFSRSLPGSCGGRIARSRALMLWSVALDATGCTTLGELLLPPADAVGGCSAMPPAVPLLSAAMRRTEMRAPEVAAGTCALSPGAAVVTNQRRALPALWPSVPQ